MENVPITPERLRSYGFENEEQYIEWSQSEFVRSQCVVRPYGAVTIINYAKPEELLEFEPTEYPAWRRESQLPSTSQMLADISIWAAERSVACPSPVVAAGIQSFSLTALADFIFHNNNAEGVGPDKLHTNQILHGITSGLPAPVIRQVTQMEASMKYLQRLRSSRLMRLHASKRAAEELESKNFGVESVALSVKALTTAHKIMFSGELHDSGQFRERPVFSQVPGGGRFSYDPPDVLVYQAELIMDLCNTLLLLDPTVCGIVKVAAYFFVLMATVHPFSDGNGRVIRLFVNFLLSSFNPFPIPLYVEDGIRTRSTYIEALMAARDLSNTWATRIRPPADLAALIVESVWLTWMAYKSEQQQAVGGSDEAAASSREQ